MNAARTFFLIALVAAAALGGCLGSSNDKATPASVADAGNATSSAPKDAMAPPNATPNATMSTANMMPVKYKGTSPQGVCTFTGAPADQCQFSSTGSESFHKIDYKGIAKHLVVDIKYPALQPGFNMYASVCMGKPGGAFNGNDCHDYKTAPSPMKMDIDLAKLAPGAPLALSIGAVEDATGAVPVLVFSQSDFEVDGHVMTTAN